MSSPAGPVWIRSSIPTPCSSRLPGQAPPKQTLIAIASDSIGLTRTVTRGITVSTFTAKKFTASTKPKKATSGPVSFTTSGKLTLPSGVTKKLGCTLQGFGQGLQGRDRLTTAI